jgi:hypothetical protein
MNARVENSLKPANTYWMQSHFKDSSCPPFPPTPNLPSGTMELEVRRYEFRVPRSPIFLRESV